MNRKRQTKLAERVRACADEYLKVVGAIQAQFGRMARVKKETGHFPADSERILIDLSQKGKRLSVRMLRLRASMIETGLSSAFEGTDIPDKMPEDW